MAPNWAIRQMALGNTLTEQTCYNDRQQPYVVRQRSGGSTHVPACQAGMTPDSYDVGFLSFAFPTNNNGNIANQTIQYAAAPGYSCMRFVQGYTYDGANRIASVTESGSSPWSQTFGYDVAGNRWLQTGTQFDSSTPATGSINPFDANNHLNGAAYADGRGNLTSDGGYGFQYDAENRLTSSSMSGSTLAAYTYDAEGHRVTKVAGTETTVYVYNVQGELAAEYTTGATTTPCATTCYLMTDHLGSTRMQTDASGNQIQLFDYAPFGEMLGNAGGRDGRWAGYTQSGIHFTGKEQEGYEGAYMHYFGARYFSGGLGRFTSPDSPFADQTADNPQSWNLYSCVRNNPLLFTDPTGQDCVYTSNQSDSSVTVTLERGDCTQKGGTYVNGTIDENSFQYNGSSLDVGFTDPNGNVGVLSTPLPGSSGSLDGLAVLQRAGAMASPAADPRFYSQFLGASLLGGVGYAAYGLYGSATLTTVGLRVARLAVAWPAAVQALKSLPKDQYRLVQEWVGQIKPGNPIPPVPAGLTPDAMQRYLDVAETYLAKGEEMEYKCRRCESPR